MPARHAWKPAPPRLRRQTPRRRTPAASTAETKLHPNPHRALARRPLSRIVRPLNQARLGRGSRSLRQRPRPNPPSTVTNPEPGSRRLTRPLARPNLIGARAPAREANPSPGAPGASQAPTSPIEPTNDRPQSQLHPLARAQRLLKRTLGHDFPQFVARFGAPHAIQRAKAELRRAKRARCRKLYSLWSEVLAQLDPDTANNTNPRNDLPSPKGRTRSVSAPYAETAMMLATIHARLTIRTVGGTEIIVEILGDLELRRDVSAFATLSCNRIRPGKAPWG